MNIIDLDEYSTSEIREQAESQYQLLRLGSSNELEFQRKVLKVKTDLKQFLKSENSVFIEEKDLDAVKNATRTIKGLGIGVMIPCFVASIYLKNFKIFGKLSKGADMSVRLFLLFGSTGGIYAYSYTQNARLSAMLELKYAFRVQQFNSTKDPRAINPNYNPPPA